MKTKVAKQSRGQAARVEDIVDLNVAFFRAYNAFLKMYHVKPDWYKANTKLQITKDSVVCVIREE